MTQYTTFTFTGTSTLLPINARADILEYMKREEEKVNQYIDQLNSIDIEGIVT